MRVSKGWQNCHFWGKWFLDFSAAWGKAVSVEQPHLVCQISLKLEPWHDSCQKVKWKSSLSERASSVQRQPYFFFPPLISLILHTRYLVPSSRVLSGPWWLNMAVWLVCGARNTCRLPSCLTEHHYRLSERQCGPVWPFKTSPPRCGCCKKLTNTLWNENRICVWPGVQRPSLKTGLYFHWH